MTTKSLFASRWLLAAVAVTLLCGLTPGIAHAEDSRARVLRSGKTAVTINFEIVREPCTFLHADPLRERYDGLGVHFSGPSELDGAAILDECAHFPVTARSGEAFLAVNADAQLRNGGIARAPITVHFDDLQESVSIWVAGPTRYKLIGKAAGITISTVSLTPGSGFGPLSLTSDLGFDTVVLRSHSGAWVVDDLALTSLT